jgi:hypothetical protein
VTDKQGEVQELTRALNKFSERTDELIRSNSSNSTITVNAGGVGVWVSVTASLMMLGMMMVGGFWLSREFGRIDSDFSTLRNNDDIHDAYINKLRAEQKQPEK